MRGTKISRVLLALVAVSLVGLLSCPAPTANTEPDPVWTFDSDEDGWETVLYDSSSNNTSATVNWSASEGSPGAGALRIEVPFVGTSEYVTVIAPITPDPLNSGTDLTGKRFSAWVKSAVAFTGYAMIFSNSGPNPGNLASPAFPSGNGVQVELNTTDWLPIELDLTQVSNPDYVPTDMRFLGVMFFTGATDPPDATYTFYVDTAVIDDAP